MAQIITPEKIENAGTVTAGISSLLSFLSLSEYLAIATFIMGFVTFVIGRIYGAQQQKQRDIQAALDVQYKKIQIERELLELETIKADLEGFKRKKEHEHVY